MAVNPDLLPDESHLRLTLRAFRRHRLARLSFWLIALMYLVAVFAEFAAPYDPRVTDRRAVYHPPHEIRLVVRDADGWRFSPHALMHNRIRDPDTLRTSYVPDPEKRIPLGFFVRGESHQLWGLIPLETRLFGPVEAGARIHLLGADRLGRDVFSRAIHGMRVSLSIGLAGVVISLALGLLLGGVSGYFGGWADALIQRVVEFMLSVPTIPIYLGLAAAIPPDLPPVYAFAAIVLILSLIGWTEIARITRGRILALRREDYVSAARLDGAGHGRIIFRHILPALTSQIVASVTLAVPTMIVVETSLSFLGLGLRPPTISWGVLLQEAQNVRSLSEAPWLFLPGVLVVASVLAFNFLGDGLRDAADPYGRRGGGAS